MQAKWPKRGGVGRIGRNGSPSLVGEDLVAAASVTLLVGRGKVRFGPVPGPVFGGTGSASV